MVRKRGGGAGQGGAQGGEKRQATTPVGGTFKDPRRNIRGDEDFEEETIPPASDIIKNLNKASSERGSIIALAERKKTGSIIDVLNERASIRGSRAGSEHGDNVKSDSTSNAYPESMYKTAPPEGCMRDVLNVEVLTRNGEDYRGTVTYAEARYEIFGKGLDLPDGLLHGIKIQFGSGPKVSFKLTEQIDVDELANVEYFTFERIVTISGVKQREVFDCRLKGLRQRRPYSEDEKRETQAQAPNVFDVKLIGCDYGVEEDEMMGWLKLYGETFGKLTENFYYDPNPKVKPAGDGTYTIKMRIDKQIPQFLPMYGKKVRVEHRAIQILCTNCYGKHPRKVCKSEKVQWMDYVERFMQANEEVTPEMYGRWAEIAKHEGRNQVRQEEPEKERRMSDEIVYGSKDMQGAIRAVKEMSVRRKRPDETTREREDEQPWTRVERNDPKVLKQIISIRNESIYGERLYELTELGLSVDAAKQLVENEEEIANVHRMLEDKRRKNKFDKQKGRESELREEKGRGAKRL